jgi:hypothetical protein
MAETYLMVEFPVMVLLLPKPIVVVELEGIEVVAPAAADVVVLASTSENWPL